MSVEIRVSIICDNCGIRIEGKIGKKTTYLDQSYRDAQRQANASHWMTLPRYGTARHLCGNCADGKPITLLKQAVVEAEKDQL